MERLSRDSLANAYVETHANLNGIPIVAQTEKVYANVKSAPWLQYAGLGLAGVFFVWIFSK